MTITERMRAAMEAASRLPTVEQNELADRILMDVQQRDQTPVRRDGWGGDADNTQSRNLRLV